MSKFQSSSADNIRFNGTGRAYMADPGTSVWEELGEMESINYNTSVSTEKLTSTRTAARATLIERETEREVGLTMGLREHTAHNLQLALLGGEWNTTNQDAGGQSALTELVYTADKYVELNKYDVFVHKVSHGTVTGGPFVVGATLKFGTGGSEPEATIAYVGTGYLEVVAPTKALPTSGGISVAAGASATMTGLEKLKDVVVVDAAAPTKRYEQGKDYTLDADYGLIRVLKSGEIPGEQGTGKCFVAYSCEALERIEAWMLSAGSKVKKFKFVADADDQGPREILTFHRVQVNMDGDFSMLGEGESIITLNCTVLADGTQPSGQEYFKLEVIQ